MTGRATLLLFGALLMTQAHGFGGAIAIGLGQANQVDTVSIPFTASATLETEEHNLTEQIYYTPGKLRDEISMGGQDMVFIRRFDLMKTWMLMPQNMYMESAIDDPNDQMEDYKLIQREVLGREVVNGEQTTKHKVVYQSSKGKYGGFTWFTDDNIAVKAFLISEEHGEKQRIRFEMTKVIRAPQPDVLFEIPGGYARMDMGAMNMAAMGAGAAAGSQMGNGAAAAAMGGGGIDMGAIAALGAAMGSTAMGGATTTATTTTASASGLSGDQQLILQIQQDLATLGYDPDPPSGTLGTKTQLAIGKFESDNGLPFTGQPTFELAVKIRSVMGGGTAAATAGTAAPAAAGSSATLAAQQACLDEAVKKKKQKKRWGALTSAGARLASRFGGAKVASDVYNTTATANDVSAIANELGLEEADVQRCIDEAAAAGQ